MPALLERRRLDLEAQLESLPRELDRWEKLTLEKAFEKHHSQVVALARQMRDLNETVRRMWNDVNDFSAIQKAQKNCAAVQRVWNYYRDKLLMRFDEGLGSYLRAADAYVWSCYEPMLLDRRAANPGQAFREPPLVAFDTEISPWAQSRRNTGEAAYHGTSSLMDPSLDPMPIAVLGIPWSTVEVLPKLAALAHETAHVVESDFALAEPLAIAVSEATKGMRLSEGWSHYWRKEVFADLFACYAAGPSFVWTMTESIPDAPVQVEMRRRPSDICSGDPWGKYPPATLRVLLNTCALRQLGSVAEADEIEKYWRADYPVHAMGEYEADLKVVVPAIYAAAGLPESLKWTALAMEYAEIYSAALYQSDELNPTQRHNPRTLVAIASDLRRKPQAGVDVDAVWGRLQRHIVASRPPGLLAGQLERTKPGAPVLLRTEEIANMLFADQPEE